MRTVSTHVVCTPATGSGLCLRPGQHARAVAFVKFPTASEAAAALENLHLKNIRNGADAVMLKVMIADDPRAPPGSAEPPRCASARATPAGAPVEPAQRIWP